MYKYKNVFKITININNSIKVIYVLRLKSDTPNNFE